ncbi:phosphate ABC transporter ATP-binding protein PstB [Ligilactobacillus equi]|uniref:phosphate ABC transporter ATP-binding protein PstB n=1 Tax=Ligilactobacillus equi TaxID=137357 RepID=UPI002ED5A540
MKAYDLEKRAIFTPKGQESLSLQDVDVFYGDNHVSRQVSMVFPKNQITALIGASGSGKSTLLRSLNRLNDGIAQVKGKIMYDGQNLNAPEANVYQIRRQIGMVFQKPNPFYKSIRKNILFGLRDQNLSKATEEEILEDVLRQAALWDEVKDKLDKSALGLSGGQQQRLCIARALALKPEVILMDEPTSALDPLATAKVEETMLTLKKEHTIIIVTHSMQQAGRIADNTAFFHKGRLMEYQPTTKMFMTPELEITQDYLSGNFG